MKRIVSLVTVVAGLAACDLVDSFGNHKCTLADCSSGLTIHLATRPPGTYRVEVLPYYPAQQPAYVYACSADTPCQQDIFFPDLIVDHAYVRVTTATGVRITEVKTVRYADVHPNGARCGPHCRNATVTVEIP